MKQRDEETDDGSGQVSLRRGLSKRGMPPRPRRDPRRQAQELRQRACQRRKEGN